jgi:hypothetical protein
MSLDGTAHQHALLDAESGVVQKLQLTVNWKPSQKPTSKVFSSETDLDAFLKKQQGAIRVTTRVRLPRLQWMGAFWPLSVRVAKEADEFYKNRINKDDGGPTDIDFVALEKPSLANMWEPLWFSPLLRGILEAQIE